MPAFITHHKRRNDALVTVVRSWRWCGASCDVRRSVSGMLIDARQGVGLGVREERAAIVVPTPEPQPGTAFPPRRLTLREAPVFELNLWCGTCPALFKRLTEPEPVDLGRQRAARIGVHRVYRLARRRCITPTERDSVYAIFDTTGC
jgi:hypothetical protein